MPWDGHTKAIHRSCRATWRARWAVGLLACVGALAAAERAAAETAQAAHMVGPTQPQEQAEAWSFERLVAMAERLAAEPFEPSPALPAKLAAWDYSDYIKLGFKPGYSVWDPSLPFQAVMFHRGFIHSDQVAMSVVRDGKAMPLRFDPAMYDYGDLDYQVADQADALGFAGFRLHAPLNGPDSYDEVIAFLGASYFRATGRGQAYGLSARGLGINTGVGEEEFPAFRAAWLHEPKPGDTSFTVDLLLDGISVTGAYRMVVTPGDTTVVEVKAELIARRDVRQLCVAPMTSMFWFGEGQKNAADFRPEVHDSDRLVIERRKAAGEVDASGHDVDVLCRPLVNPVGPQPRRTAYPVEHLSRFGLLQRDRRFESYVDLDLRYDLRPSLWVEPIGEWGPGVVELYEFPTSGETVDNVVAYWVPEEALRSGQRRSYDYRLLWTRDESPGHSFAQVTETYNQPLPGGRVRTIVEFAGAALQGMSQQNPPRPVLEGLGDDVVMWTRPNVARGGWRALFEWTPRSDTAEQPSTIRLWLSGDRDHTVSETWNYPVRP